MEKNEKFEKNFGKKQFKKLLFKRINYIDVKAS